MTDLMAVKLLLFAVLTTAIRLYGNASVVILTGIDPRPVAIRKRLTHWVLSAVAAALALTLVPAVTGLLQMS